MFSRAVRRPPACRRSVAAGRPVVEGGGDAGAQLVELGAHVAVVAAPLPPPRPRAPSAVPTRRVVLVDAQEHVPGLHGVADATGPAATVPAARGLDDVFHLHGLEQEQDGARRDLSTGRDVHAEHGAGEGHRELGQPSHRGAGTSKPTSVPQVLR